MKWTPQQDAALKAVDEWLEFGSAPVFRLFGYAGTGKTTLATYIAEHVDGKVLFEDIPIFFKCGDLPRPFLYDGKDNVIK